MTSATERLTGDPGHATAARYEDGCLFVTLSTGRVVREPIDRYAWLASASPGARARVEVADFGTVIRWPELDEDVGVATILGVSEEVVASLSVSEESRGFASTETRAFPFTINR